MKKFVKRIALVLVLVLLMTSLGGCNLLFTLMTLAQMQAGVPDLDFPDGPVVIETEPNPETTPIPQTTPAQLDTPTLELVFSLTQEDLAEIDALIDTCKEISYSETATREEVEAAWDELDEKLNYVSDETLIAQVLYYLDTTQEEANQLYLDTYDEYLALADKANLVQKDMYEDSPVKDWFFEDWTEAEIAYLKSYTSEQVQIQAELNEINTQFVEMSDDVLHEEYTDLYIRMVTLGNQMAKLSGYENYYEYSAAMSFNRDYGAAEREQFRNHVKNVIMPVFGDCYDSLMAQIEAMDYDSYMFFNDFSFNDFDSLSRNYLQEYIDSQTGSTYDHLVDVFNSGNYILTDDSNAYEGAFCGYLEYYDLSLCYFGPGYQSTTTVVHEMGHYYANSFADDYTPLDLLETHSQGNEALLLAHVGENPPAGYDFVRYYELFDMLLTMIISCMVDDFESRIYTMESVEGLTTEDFDRIINEICDEYFGAYGGADYVNTEVNDMQWYIRKVTGLSPAYYISYATSVVTTMNIFALAEQDREAARELYRQLVEEAPLVEGYVAALESVGAASPFEEESFTTIVKLFQ